MDKIKEFIAQNKKLVIIGGGVLALLVIVGIVLALVLGGGDTAAGSPGCTVAVKTEGGMALEGVGVYIYTDADKKELVSYAKTNTTGAVAFTETIPAGSVIVLEDVPAGYTVAENYPVTAAEVAITLPSQLLQEMTRIQLGGIMFDFTVTDTDGTEHTLSELLKEKKAVALNLWYTHCEPCKMEFPYLQQAFDAYSGDLALLALDPVADDDDAAIAAFKTANNLTFPMAKCDAKWAELVDGIAYPTTIIIDRYGMISLVHVGSIDNAKTFEDVFAHFTAEDYVQAPVKEISELVTQEEVAGQGTQDNPIEIGGQTAFDVTVEAGQTVYCNLYRLSGMELSVQSDALKIVYGETEYVPAEGVIKFFINTTDPMTPALLAFTNTGSATQTYKVTMSAPLGAMDNPLSLELGDFTAEIAEGNTQGLHYTYSAAEEGNFVITVKKAPKGVQYGIALNNLTTSKYLTLDADGAKDNDGNKTLTVAVNKRDEIQVIVTVLPDAQNVCPAATLKLNAAIAKEEDPTQGNSTGSTPGGSTDSTPGGSTDSTPGGNYNGTLVNPDAPIEQFGFNDFEIEVGAGEKKLVYLVRTINNATFRIKDKDAYVVYKGKTYKPNSSGTISISMKSEGSFTPLEVEIGNAGSAAKTFKVDFLFAKGSRENPNKLELGETTVKCTAGNDQGTFYTYKTSTAGTLTLEIKSVNPSSVICAISISDMQAIPNVVELEEGATSVSIELPAGAKAEITFFTKDPNKEWKIPAAEILIAATFA